MQILLHTVKETVKNCIGSEILIKYLDIIPATKEIVMYLTNICICIREYLDKIFDILQVGN